MQLFFCCFVAYSLRVAFFLRLLGHLNRGFLDLTSAVSFISTSWMSFQQISPFPIFSSRFLEVSLKAFLFPSRYPLNVSVISGWMTKSSFPSPEAARKLLYLATVDIKRKWTRPIMNWPQVLNQLAIRFEDRIDF